MEVEVMEVEVEVEVGTQLGRVGGRERAHGKSSSRRLQRRRRRQLGRFGLQRGGWRRRSCGEVRHAIATVRRWLIQCRW